MDRNSWGYPKQGVGQHALRKRSIIGSDRNQVSRSRPICLYGSNPTTLQTRLLSIRWVMGVNSVADFLLMEVSGHWVGPTFFIAYVYVLGAVL